MKPSEVAAMRVLAWCQKNGCVFTDSVRASLARELDRFAGERVAEERERCAKVADVIAADHRKKAAEYDPYTERLARAEECVAAKQAENIAAAIRSGEGGTVRGQNIARERAGRGSK